MPVCTSKKKILHVVLASADAQLKGHDWDATRLWEGVPAIYTLLVPVFAGRTLLMAVTAGCTRQD